MTKKNRKHPAAKRTNAPEKGAESRDGWIRKYRWLLRIGLAVAFPLILLAVLETGWRLSGKHYDWHLFAKAEDSRYLGTNGEFGYRFFARAIARKPVPSAFQSEKPPKTYRIFVLGASAAVGIPNAAFGFHQVLDVMLEQQFPGYDFEMVNAALTAINSHVVLPIAAECAGYEPDLFVVYLGNNELVGPFSAGSSQDRRASSLAQIRSLIELRKTGIGQMAQSLGERLAGHDQLLERWDGMQMYVDNFLRHDDPAVTLALENFETNLTDIVKTCTAAEADVVLSTVAVNLQDCAPFASLHRPDLSEADREAWQRLYEQGQQAAASGDHEAAATAYGRAEAIDNQYAELHYRWGKSLMAAGNLAEAALRFGLARDHDALRFRAESRINEIIRRVSNTDEHATLADSEDWIGRWCRQRDTLPGNNAFYEHVHLTFLGNYLLAESVFHQVARVLPAEIRQTMVGGLLPGPQDCAKALALTSRDEYRMLWQISTMVQENPFTRQYDHEQNLGRVNQALQMLKDRATPEEAQGAVGIYQQALAARPDDLMMRFNYAKLLEEIGYDQRAANELRFIERRLPQRVFTREESRNPR